MQTHVQGVLIAVGTEITSGQIINRNTGWLAVPLAEAGLAPLIHWSVPDNRALILEALQAAEKISPLVFLTGGLGPTSDDFTRQLVAEWSQKPLVFNDDSWQRIVKRAKDYQFTLVESQKQQCWFPESAEILCNPIGTADAFWISHNETQVIVLPGPPREIAALWESTLKDKLKPFFPPKSPQTLYTWQCMGIPEGTLAEQVDQVLEPFNVEIGYRAHFPYIEVKVWIAASENHDHIQRQLEPILRPWAVLQHGEEAAQRFCDALIKFSAKKQIHIYDGFTGGTLLERLLPTLRKAPELQRRLLLTQGFGALPDMDSKKDTLAITLCPPKNNHLDCQVIWQKGTQTDKLMLRTPSRYDTIRQQRYVAEQFLLKLHTAWTSGV